MSQLINMLRWDITLQARNYIYVANVISTAAIIVFVLLLPVDPLPVPAASFFIFTDPALIGLSFIGCVITTDDFHCNLIGTTMFRPPECPNCSCDGRI